ncbi:hypothetical protein [Cellvibrio sp. KY-YJ-3]|uniref:hypothetical protein n=1 Tax=Cellvibrio sp. KY-YJ-3 TaxID=454662 RepID=UPI001247AA84|nr:hypothetical protein [Cellvibrio sp. KY-YJ-3]
MSKPLASANVPDTPRPVAGDWLSEDGSKQLSITKAGNQGWYSFRYTEEAKKTEGRFVVSYFKQRMVFNVDLVSVRINGRPVVNSETPVYMLFGAAVNNENLRVSPAQMDKFEQHFADYFFASPMNTKNLCSQTLELCAASFTSGNLLLSKRMRKFNDEFMKKFRTIFPSKNQVVFNRR